MIKILEKLFISPYCSQRIKTNRDGTLLNAPVCNRHLEIFLQVYACVYVCLYVCICVLCMYVCMYVCMFSLMYT